MGAERDMSSRVREYKTLAMQRGRRVIKSIISNAVMVCMAEIRWRKNALAITLLQRTQLYNELLQNALPAYGHSVHRHNNAWRMRYLLSKKTDYGNLTCYVTPQAPGDQEKSRSVPSLQYVSELMSERDMSSRAHVT